MDPTLIFSAIAVLIIAVAILISFLFRRSIKREKSSFDLNADKKSGQESATWIGIGETNDH